MLDPLTAANSATDDVGLEQSARNPRHQPREPAIDPGLSPLRSISSAIRMNSGIAVRVKLFMLPQLTRPSALNPLKPP